ncbi:CarD family transcriptional regulator [uncultured Eubacterium sp.]|uniref:CarD family transcriptional regulator n=1 Tax=uncultured Eubacterium sp. TaxID=165185 RepID=UPI000E85A07C|nr:CarD family transcriptional regulator [uncultured Eubacterium sp.]HAH18950.1 CarD family transcriptional regulator [Eubacterium sp.]HAV90350.1 CarD family transcriptional regulator [Eubacterium sp.]
MFEIGDYIIYGNSGVCKVEAVGKLDIPGIPNNVDYYTLSPVYMSSKIYTPIDNDKVVIRPIITNIEAEELIDEIKDIEPYNERSDKVCEEKYKESLNSCDLKKIVRTIKTLYNVKLDRKAHGKKITNSDDKYFKMASEKLYSELAVALHIEKKDVENYVISRIDG